VARGPGAAELLRQLRAVYEAKLNLQVALVDDEEVSAKLRAAKEAHPLFQEREYVGWATCGEAVERSIDEQPTLDSLPDESLDRFIRDRLCVGQQLGRDGRCYAHTGDDDARADALAEIREGGDFGGFLRGVPVDPEMLRRVLDATNRDSRGHPRVDNADFSHTRFNSPAFTDLVFEGAVVFEKSRFFGSTRFDSAVFAVPRADFTNATFEGEVDFGRSKFEGTAFFLDTTFKQRARFELADFRGDWWGPALFESHASFMRATFRSRIVGPIYALDRLNMPGANFIDNVVVQAGAAHMSFDNATFLGTADLQLRWAEVTLQWASFGHASIVRGTPSFGSTGVSLGDLTSPFEERFRELGGDLANRRPDLPRLVSLHGTDVGNLALSSMDLRPCRFLRAHNLERLRVGNTCRFAFAPRGWRYTHRQTIAEEQQWRKSREKDRAVPTSERSGGGDARELTRWYGPELRHSQELGGSAPENPAEIAAMYRALRKGREVGGDEPGAADFYYGEMEMRRLASSTPLAERLILLLYWLTAGYGLGLSLYFWGFPHEEPLVGALLYSIQSTTSLLRAPEAELTYVGQVFQIVLRLLGPLFFGLALLSLRGRVRR
jgi:uncharacterized protein YjbI with pentapeptide repeats